MRGNTIQNVIYGGNDPRVIPAYALTEASKYIHLPVSTLRSWIKGRTYTYQDTLSFSQPLISQQKDKAPFISFNQLIESHILKALRTIHHVSMKNVRIALETAQQKFDIENLLLSSHLKTGAKELFLDRYGELINLSRSGQYAMKEILEAHLERVEYDSFNLPFRFYPFLLSDSTKGKKSIVIDPAISFGKPVIAKKNISTLVIANRIDAGELMEDVADDYDLDPQDIKDAIIYEKAA